MIGRRPRKLSQHSYQIVQDIRRENDRLRQVRDGLHYRVHATQRLRFGMEAPLHIGPQIELTVDDAYKTG